MAAKTINVLGSKFVYQEKPDINPKLFDLRAINKKKYWTNNKKIALSICSLLIIISIVVGCIPLYLKKDNCNNFKCENGICVNGSNEPVCSCFQSYYGDKCESYDYCFNINCLNSGQCNIKSNGFKCNCTNGYYGKYCESYNSCWDSPCEGCQPVKPNSTEYLCTCSKYNVSKCISENQNEIITSLTLVELSDLRLVSSYDDNSIRITNQNNNSTQKLNGHTDRINALIEYKSDILISGSCDKTIILWNTTNYKIIKNLTYHNDCVNVLLSITNLNNKILVSGSDDKKIQFWNESNLINSINVKHQVKSLAYSEKNNYLAVGTSDSSIQLWKLINYNFTNIKYMNYLDNSIIVSSVLVYQNYFITGLNNGTLLKWYLIDYSIVKNINAHQLEINNLILINNLTFASCSSDKTIKIWNKNSLELINTLYSNEPLYSISILSNSILISGSKNGILEIWNLNTFQIVKNISVDTNIITHLIILDNNYVATVSSFIKIWNSSSWDLIKNITNPAFEYSNLIVDNNGNLIASTEVGTIIIYDKSTFEPVNSVIADNTEISLLITTQDNKLLSGTINTIKVWDVNTLNCLATLNEINNQIIYIISLENNQFASFHGNNAFKIWSLDSVDLVFNFNLNLSSHISSVTSVTYLDESRLISGSSDSTIKVWDMFNLVLLSTLTGHTQTITCLTLVNDAMFASGSLDSKIIIWNNYLSNDILKHHQGRINSIIYSRNKSVIISSSSDRNIIFWEISYSLNKLNDLTGHKRQIEDVLFLNDDYLLSASDDFTIKLWNINSSINTLTLNGHTDDVYRLLELNDKNIASCSRDQTIIIWSINNFTTFDKLKVLYGHSKAVISLAILQQDLLASGSCDKTINIWNITSYTLINTLTGHKGCINDLIEFRSKYLISVSDDESIYIWDATNLFNLIDKKDVSSPINALTASDAYFAVGLSNGEILIYGDGISYKKDLNDFKEEIIGLLSYDSNILGLSKNGNLKVWNSKLELISSNNLDNSSDKFIIFNQNLITTHDGFIIVWNMTNNFSLIRKEKAHNISIFNLLNYYDQFLITGPNDCNIKVWDSEFKLNLTIYFSATISSLALLKNSLIAIGLYDSTIKIFNIKTNSEIKTLSKHKKAVNVLYTLPNGNLASGSNDNMILIWDIDNYELIAVLSGHLNSIESLVVLPNGNLLSGSSDQKIKLWDSTTFKCLTTVETDNTVNSLVMLNSTHFISGTFLFKLWHLENLAFISQLNGHKDQVTDLKFLPNENLISSSMDKSISLWDILTLKKLASNSEHNRSVLALDYLSNEKIVSGSEDKTIKIWQIRYHSPKSI